MNSAKTDPQFVARRAELLAELFLQDLGAKLISGPASDADYDFIVGFPNSEGGVNFSTVEVEATERPVTGSYPLNRQLYKRLANSNLPSLLLVVDAKKNRIYHSWPSPDQIKKGISVHTLRVPVVEVDEQEKKKIRERLARG